MLQEERRALEQASGRPSRRGRVEPGNPLECAHWKKCVCCMIAWDVVFWDIVLEWEMFLLFEVKHGAMGFWVEFAVIYC